MPSMKRRFNVSLDRRLAMELHRVAVGRSRLVYVVVQDKKISYPGHPRRCSREPRVFVPWKQSIYWTIATGTTMCFHAKVA